MNPQRTVVLGLGNPLISDDQAGLAVAEAVRGLLTAAPVPGVDVITSNGGGLDLIELLTGYSRALVVDCLAVADASPGRVHEFGVDSLGCRARLMNAHETGIQDVFRLADELDIPMPGEVVIFAIEAGDLITFSEQMTRQVESAVDSVARKVYGLLCSVESK